jgi:hypothetical protein
MSYKIKKSGGAPKMAPKGGMSHEAKPVGKPKMMMMMMKKKGGKHK